jgi:hypothetical protein
MPESNLIFVSYAHPNLALVRKLVRFLQTGGEGRIQGVADPYGGPSDATQVLRKQRLKNSCQQRFPRASDHFANRNSDGASRMDLGRLFKHQALRQK